MIQKSTIYNLENSIQIEVGQVISESIINNENIDITLFGFYKGENISLEKSDYDRIYLPIENVLNMKVQVQNPYCTCNKPVENNYCIEPYDFTVIERNLYRQIDGNDNYKILMITIKRKEIVLKNIEKQKLLKLTEEIQYQENKIASKTLANDEKLNMTLLAFDGKQELSTHSAPGDAFVIALDGEAKITIDGTDFNVQKGDSIIMPANIPHSVSVDGKYKMLLIVSK